jgi:hypothetical protein
MRALVPGPEHYAGLRYDTKCRWSSYWHQIDEVVAVQPASVLVVGVGNAVVPKYLRDLGIEVVTLDLAEHLGPDLVGDIRSIPLTEDGVELALCCQVLEHLPFADVPGAVAELARVASSRVVVSVPRHGRAWEFAVRIPPFARIACRGVLPSRHGFAFDGEHHWELGTRTTPRSAFLEVLEEHVAVERSFLVPEHVYHEFFVCDVLPVEVAT